MNKKIVFGIILFCAISFIAYTFANPMENEQGNLGGSNGTTVGGNENSGKPTENEPTQTPTEPEKPAEETKEPTTPVGPIAETIDVSKITASQTSYTLKRGEKVQINATVLPSNATDKTLTYKSNNISVATVSSNGLVTARAVGGTTIIITSNNGKTARVTINVVSSQSTQDTKEPDTEIKATGIETTTNISDGALALGKSMQISVTVSPANTTNKNVTYSSNNPSVATVDENGKVTSHKPGTATITVKTSNGITKDILVTVYENVASNIEIVPLLGATGLNGKLEGNTLKIYGTVNKSAVYTVRLKISVPSMYPQSMLTNIKAELNVGNLDVPKEATNKITDGSARIMLYLTNYAIEQAEKEKITLLVDWLNNGQPVKYYIDLTGIQFN